MSEREVTVRLKPAGDCGCGCGRSGVLRTKPWRNGVICVSRGCTCKSCQGKRNKTMGGKSQRKGKKILGLQTAGSIHTGHEENDAGLVRWENKRDVSICRPVHTAWNKTEKQNEASRALGDNRPFVSRFDLPGSRFALIAMRDDKLDDTIVRLAVQRGLADEVIALAEQLGMLGGDAA